MAEEESGSVVGEARAGTFGRLRSSINRAFFRAFFARAESSAQRTTQLPPPDAHRSGNGACQPPLQPPLRGIRATQWSKERLHGSGTLPDRDGRDGGDAPTTASEYTIQQRVVAASTSTRSGT